MTVSDAVVAVDRRTGEIVAVCTPDEARALTDRIKASAETLWSLLIEAHTRKAWKALGYSRWEDYCAAEFDITRNYSYRLLHQALVIREIETVLPDGNTAAITEAQARDIKPVLPDVVADIRDRLASVPDAQPEQVQDIVREAIAEKRSTPTGTRTYAKSAASKSLPAALASLGGIAIAFRSVRPDDLREIAPEDAASWARDLTDVISALRSLRDLLKEQAA